MQGDLHVVCVVLHATSALPARSGGGQGQPGGTARVQQSMPQLLEGPDGEGLSKAYVALHTALQAYVSGLHAEWCAGLDKGLAARLGQPLLRQARPCFGSGDLKTVDAALAAVSLHASRDKHSWRALPMHPLVQESSD